MYTDNRNAYRQIFFDVWQKHLKKLPLQTVEAQVIDVILSHPEYHTMLEDQKTFMTQEFSLQENPFIHMSLHIALREQLQIDKPAGVKQVAQNLLQKYSLHDVEHLMTTVIANMMYQSQQTGSAPNDSDYLHQLRTIV